MFAVVEAGGRQYRVEPGAVVKMEKVPQPKGEAISFERVLMVGADGGSLRVGRPYVEGASVSGTVVAQDRDNKIVVFRYKPKKRVRIKRGHRQYFSLIKIDNING